MVGVPRSSGCLLCVKRRVKCDEERPGCGNCAKYGAECPGYDRAFKFVAGKHHVRQRRKDENQSEIELNSSSINPATGSSTLSPLVVLQRRPLQDATAFSIPPTLGGLRPEHIYGIINHLYVIEPRHEVSFFAPWFTSVPEHIGQKSHLDSAMSAFTLHLLGKAKCDSDLIGESRSMYGQSLCSLQKALNHPTEWKSAETLCATMLLCLYELFAGTSNSASWMKHAVGVSRLIQQRGSKAHENPFDRSMLLSFRPMIIMNALFSGQDCFLAKRNWQKILKTLSVNAQKEVDPSNHIITLVSRDTLVVVDRYFANLAKLPTILRHGYELKQNRKHGMPIDHAQVILLVQGAKTLHADMADWFHTFVQVAGEPVEVASQDPSSIYDTVLSYENIWVGSLFMGYWATMLIIQEVIQQCDQTDEYGESNRELARNIYRSLERVSAGIMGPYRVGYSLRISYDFADVDTQIWIRSLLDRFEKTYAATSASTYPKPEANEYGYQ